jgi:hypothetical protein
VNFHHLANKYIRTHTKDSCEKLTSPPSPPLVCIFLDVCEELWRLLLGLPWPFIYFCFVVGLSVGGIDEHLRGEEGGEWANAKSQIPPSLPSIEFMA